MNHKISKKQIQYNKLLRRAKSHRYWLIGSVLLALFFAFLFNHFKVPEYRVNATVFVKSMQPSLSDPANLIFSEGVPRTNLTNTIDQSFMFRSFPMVAAAIDKLNFSISYYDNRILNQLSLPPHLFDGKVGGFLADISNQVELYNQSPVKLEVAADATSIPYDEEVPLIIKSKERYSITLMGETSTHAFGQPVDLHGFKFLLTLIYPEKTDRFTYLTLKVHPYEDLVFTYRDDIQVQPILNESSILKISIVGKNPEKEIDFINRLTEAVIEQDLKEKNYNAEKTVDFIDQQLAVNSDSLKVVENELQRFKQENSAIELSSRGEQLFGNIQELEKEKALLSVSNQYFDYLVKSLRQNENVEQLAVPASVGIDDPVLTQLISQMVNIQLEVKAIQRQLSAGNTGDATLMNKKAAVEELKQNILVNIQNRKAANAIAIDNLNRRITQYSSSLDRLPSAERKLVNIKRIYTLNENLYMLLMEKKVEAGITATANVSDYKVVESAMVDGPPVGISKLLLIFLALVVGIGLPLGFFFLQILLSNKIQSKEDIELYTDHPILGSIIHADEDSKQNSHSLLYECFRHIRANLMYLTPKQETKIIMVTSSTSGEGKSFCTWHLARVLAMSFKKTVIIDSDMRKHDGIKKISGDGLSEYLAGMVDDSKIIRPTENELLDHIKSGSIPPNPAELILSKNMEALLEKLKQDYEYIIIDTPPVGIVADSMAFLKSADVIFCIARANYTNTDQFSFTIQKLTDIQPNHLSIMFNDAPISNSSHYGNYYYNNKKEKQVVWDLT